jgi:IclR family transcriptional regulator, pca regulon regulatory protein
VNPAQGDNGAGDKGQPPRTRGIRPGRLSYSLQSGIALLLMFSEERQVLGIAEMADLAGLSRPTTHRYASTFVQLGFLEQGPKRKYRLAPRAADPGATVIRGIRRALPARAVLEELRDKIGYTVSLGALDGTRVIYVHRLFGHRRGQHMIDRELRVGAYIPAYCTALGKVLLASLFDAERRARVANIHLVPQGPRSITVQDKLLAELDAVNLLAPLVSDEEFVVGARSIAMLHSRPGDEQPTAIDVTVPSTAYTTAQLFNQIGPDVMRAANLISET